MLLHLAPHVRIAMFDGRAVVLDIAADRYRLVGERAACALTVLTSGLPCEDKPAVQALVDAGFLVSASSGSRTAALPSKPIYSSSHDRLSAPAMSRTIVAMRLMHTMAELRWRGFARSLALAAARKARHCPLVANAKAASAIAGAYARARPSIPIAPICLRDALTLSGFLIDAGIESTFVIGVKLDPFAAHSWVQAGPLLLTDELDLVAAFTPIHAV